MLIGLIAAVMIFVPLMHRKDVSLILDRNKVATTDQRIALSSAVYTGKDNRGRTFSITAGQAVQLSSHEPVVKLPRG
jgi:lipopolysaccharide export system protein LptC